MQNFQIRSYWLMLVVVVAIMAMCALSINIPS